MATIKKIEQFGEFLRVDIRDDNGKSHSVRLHIASLSPNERNICPVVSIDNKSHETHCKDSDHQICQSCLAVLQTLGKGLDKITIEIVADIRFGKFCEIVPSTEQEIRGEVLESLRSGKQKTEVWNWLWKKYPYARFLLRRVLFSEGKRYAREVAMEMIENKLYLYWGASFDIVKGKLMKIDFLSLTVAKTVWREAQKNLRPQVEAFILRIVNGLNSDRIDFSAEEIFDSVVSGSSSQVKIIFSTEVGKRLKSLRRTERRTNPHKRHDKDTTSTGIVSEKKSIIVVKKLAFTPDYVDVKIGDEIIKVAIVPSGKDFVFPALGFQAFFVREAPNGTPVELFKTSIGNRYEKVGTCKKVKKSEVA